MIKLNKSYLLAILAVLLATTCIISVCSPVRFDEKKAAREYAVKERLLKIRHAEEVYRKANGTYAGDFNTLVNSGLLADSLQYIPYAKGKQFNLTVTSIITKSGRSIQLMECGVMYADYLYGLDENSIANLTEEAERAGKYPGLKIGDITTPNNNAGNWE